MQGEASIQADQAVQSHLIRLCSGAFTLKSVGGDATLFCKNAGRIGEIINYYERLQIHDAGNSEQCVMKGSIQAWMTNCQEGRNTDSET